MRCKAGRTRGPAEEDFELSRFYHLKRGAAAAAAGGGAGAGGGGGEEEEEEEDEKECRMVNIQPVLAVDSFLSFLPFLCLPLLLGFLAKSFSRDLWPTPQQKDSDLDIKHDLTGRVCDRESELRCVCECVCVCFLAKQPAGKRSTAVGAERLPFSRCM